MGKQSQNALQQRRQGLLAMVHIALKDLGICDDDYRDILKREFGVSSAAALSGRELRELIERFKSKGWAARGKGGKVWRPKNTEGQLRALRDRARGLASEIENGKQRLAGLCKKICGVDKVEWVRDVEKVKRLVVVLGKIKNK